MMDQFRLVYSGAYTRGLAKILNHIEDNFGPSVANRVERHIADGVKVLETYPYAGLEVRNTRQSDIRKLVLAGKSVIIYRIERNVIQLVNIYDSRTNWQSKV